jgi:hypothetical protein
MSGRIVFASSNMSFRSYIEFALFCVLLTPATACLAPTSCTSDLRLYDVEVKRDLAIPFAEASKLSFEACVGSGGSSRCETVQVVAGKLGTGQVGGLVHGTVSELAGGNARVEAKIQVHDGVTSSPTPVSLRAVDSSGALILDVTGQVRWEDEACHPQPLDRSI